LHTIEPYYNWRYLYTAEEDELSPFYGNEYSEFEFSNTVYNYYVHPQWDDIGSKTMYLKILFTDYEVGYTIIELIGEWNDAIENDVMTLKRNIIDLMIAKKIFKFILVCENVLTFYNDNDCYYEEWYDDVKEENGWIAFVNMPQQNMLEFKRANVPNYVHFLEEEKWRTYKPELFFQEIENKIE
jgi:hypothetical protein